jgi:hypothetical protein
MTLPELPFTVEGITQLLVAALVAGAVLGLVAVLTRVRG